MKARTIIALLLLTLWVVSFSGCRSQELCPAYSDQMTECGEQALTNG